MRQPPISSPKFSRYHGPLFFLLCASLASSLDAPIPKAINEYDIISLVNTNAALATSVTVGTSALVTAKNPEAGRSYTIGFSGGNFGVTYRVMFLSAFYSQSNGFSALQSNGVQLLAAARGGSIPPPFNTAVAMGFNLTFYSPVADNGPGPQLLVWAYETSALDVPPLPRGNSFISPCKPLVGCLRCLSVPGCSFCAAETTRNLGVCQWTGITTAALPSGKPTFKTLSAPSWACRVNQTFANTCNNASRVHTLEWIKTVTALEVIEKAEAEAAAFVLSQSTTTNPTTTNVSSQINTNTTWASSLSPLDLALLQLDPALNTPTATSGGYSRFTVYGVLIGSIHIVTGLLIAAAYGKMSRVRSAGRGTQPSAEVVGILVLLARTAELYAALCLDGSASFKVLKAVTLMQQEPGLTVPPDDTLAAALSGRGVEFPGAEYLTAALPLLRVIVLLVNDVGIVLAPAFLLAAMPKKLLSAREAILGGVQADTLTQALWKLLPASFIGLIIAALCHTTRWVAVVAARAGASSLENVITSLNKVSPIELTTPGVLPFILYQFCPIVTTQAQPDGGVSHASLPQWYSALYSIGAFVMLCIVFAGIVETISGVARIDKVTIAPVHFTPAIVMGIGAAFAAAAVPAEVVVAWISLCTISVSDSSNVTAAADARSFLASVTTPAAATIVGCSIFLAGTMWQAHVDKKPPVADRSPGILLSSGAEEEEEEGGEEEEVVAVAAEQGGGGKKEGGKKDGESDPSTPLPKGGK